MRSSTTLRAKVADQARVIEELETEASRLRRDLDIEQRFLSDTAPHSFKSWLKKQPRSAFAEKLFEGSSVLAPARGSRGLYEAYLRRLEMTEEEHQEFVRLWKLMLLTQP